MDGSGITLKIQSPYCPIPLNGEIEGIWMRIGLVLGGNRSSVVGVGATCRRSLRWQSYYFGSTPTGLIDYPLHSRRLQPEDLKTPTRVVKNTPKWAVGRVLG